MAAPTDAPVPVKGDRLGLIAIVVGTSFIAWTAILVRFADVGPLTSAAWRMLIAVPALSVWTSVLKSQRATAGKTVAIDWKSVALPLILAGLCFAADVASFHFSLTGTSVANASFIGNIAPILAVVGGTLFFHEHPSAKVWVALALSLAGGWVMSGMVPPLSLSAGDLWALAAAVAYCSYLLFIKQVRGVLDGPAATLWSAAVSAIVLTAAALWLEPRFFPQTMLGWGVVLALGIGSHTFGQGLTSIAVGRVPVGVVAAVILAQPPVSTVLAWLVVGERVNLYQICGGAIILVALVLARPK